MTTKEPKLLTADDLLRLYSQGVEGELIRGVLCGRETPTGQMHSFISANLTALLWTFNRTHGFGIVLAGNPGILLESGPDTVRRPDVAFYSKDRLGVESLVSGYSEVSPDLAAVILSPGDTRGSLYDEAQMWRGSGVRMVWAVYPDSRTVEVHAEGHPITTVTEDDLLDGLDVLPGFSCAVSEIFGDAGAESANG